MADIHDLMKLTGQGRQAVTTAVNKGELPGYRVGQGNKIWVPDDALEALREGRWIPASRANFKHVYKHNPLVKKFDPST